MLILTKYPWHKRPVLAVEEGTGLRILARFESDEAMDEFESYVKRGLGWIGDREVKD